MQVLTGSAAVLLLVPKPITRACENPRSTGRGPCFEMAHSMAGMTAPAWISRPAKMVASHKPRAARVELRLQARSMLAAIKEAMPIGLVHRTPTTILLMAALKTCMRFTRCVRQECLCAASCAAEAHKDALHSCLRPCRAGPQLSTTAVTLKTCRAWGERKAKAGRGYSEWHTAPRQHKAIHHSHLSEL